VKSNLGEKNRNGLCTEREGGEEKGLPGWTGGGQTVQLMRGGGGKKGVTRLIQLCQVLGT